MVQGVIHQFRELSGEYRIVLASPPPHDVLPIEAELDAEPCEAAVAHAQASLVSEAALFGGTARAFVKNERKCPANIGIKCPLKNGRNVHS